ncbi:opacity protein-like surface antigen [Chryseobacterium vietnamense]|jgi:opacity protein-like surface antigen|uniref:Opacity protein-like surface antigen n=1 Tax=Chryseobacterium vietnamense TaxID=866785 RepID=A0ACC6J4K1_9FLAO|nr:porin family protein [Chryseobacterium vietnamense]MDR6457970.1 opacity protein-like surface antigen [Chryseobacterium vietnamense]MDR6486681.1 opacity protein-like surface antigen [Chryseobacterium vietnamense]
MKKIFLGLALIAGTFTFAQSTSTSTEATTPSSSKIKFGLKAGLNVSNLSNMDMKSRAGFYGGVFVNIPVAKDFSVQPEVLYSAVGAKEKGGSNAKLELEYISVPVMFQYKALPNFYVEAGPQFSFLMDARLKNNVGSLHLKDATRGFDFGIGLGAGYDFTKNIGVNVRYTAGLSDIVNKSHRYLYGYDREGSVKNGVFQVGVNYKF